MKEKVPVLCVDDEPELLDGLKLQLRKGYRVHTATSGAAGLALLKEHPECCVVLSDMRMPEMDGASFLTAVREQAPEATRMLLTGQSELDAAIAAINEGQIFRFLTKPCPPERLRQAFEDAHQQYRLVTGRRVLLEKTLKGSVKILAEVLSLASPLAFGRADVIKRLATSVARRLNLTTVWQVEIAATFAHLGSVALADETARRLHDGNELSDEERQQVAKVPQLSCDLVRHIPHLERIGRIIEQSAGDGTDRYPEAAILALCTAFADRLRAGTRPDAALASLRERFDLSHIEALAQVVADEQHLLERREISLQQLSEGMILAEDLYHSNGNLLVASGFEVSAPLLGRLQSIGDKDIKPPLVVYVHKGA